MTGEEKVMNIIRVGTETQIEENRKEFGSPPPVETGYPKGTKPGVNIIEEKRAAAEAQHPAGPVVEIGVPEGEEGNVGINVAELRRRAAQAQRDALLHGKQS